MKYILVVSILIFIIVVLVSWIHINFGDNTFINNNNTKEGLMTSSAGPGTNLSSVQKNLNTKTQDSDKSTVGSIARGLDTLFHDTIEDIKQQSNAYFPQTDTVTVKDICGNKIKIDTPKYGAGFTYYKPGLYKYSADSYVPDYEDSVLLSRSIGLVPRLKGDFFIPADGKSIETDYVSSNLLITSSKSTYFTPSGTSISSEPTDNVTNQQLQKDNDKTNQLLANYLVEKTEEEIEYETRVANLLAVQNEIMNYATPAPMNIQTKIPQNLYSIATPTATVTNALLTIGPSISQKNKNDIFKIGAGAPISTNYLLMTSDQ